MAELTGSNGHRPDGPALAAAPEARLTPLGPLLGTTGLRQSSGFLFEEFDRTLQGGRLWEVIRQIRDSDPIAGAMLFAAEMLIRRVAWKWEPPARYVDDDEAKRWAEYVAECDEEREESWDDWLAEALSFLPFGFHLSEVGYGRRADGRIGWETWSTRAQETIYRWEIDRRGRTLGAYQYDPYNASLADPPTVQGSPLVPGAMGAWGGEVYLPMDRLIHLRTTRQKNSPEGRSVLRNAIEPWWMRKNIQRVEGIGIERNLAGLPMARVPANLLVAQPTLEDAAALAYVKAMVTGTRKDEQGGIILPSTTDPDSHKYIWEFELIRPSGSVAVDTEAPIARYGQQEAMVLLADFMFLGHKGVGSYALADNKSMYFSAGVDAFLDVVGDAAARQGARRLVALNGGDPRKAPRRTHTGVQEVPVDVMAKAMQAFALAGANFWEGDKDAALELMQEIFGRFGVKRPVKLGTPLTPSPGGINATGQTGALPQNRRPAGRPTPTTQIAGRRRAATAPTEDDAADPDETEEE